jgi:two-component system LytT family response regulator
MGMTAQAYSPIAAKHVGSIRVVLCDPDHEVRAQLKAILDCDPLLTVVAEPRDWRTCCADIDNLVPELLIIRVNLLPRDWFENSSHDTFAPLILPLKENYAGTVEPGPLLELRVPIVVEDARRSLCLAVTEIYDRKAKQLLYLVGRYVAASNPTSTYDSVLRVEREGQSEQVRTDSIVAVEAARKSVVVHTLDGQSVLHEPMHRIIEKLDPSTFIRIHRSIIINGNRMNRAATPIEKPSEIVMQDGSRYPVGRNYRQSLAEYLRRRPAIS